MTQRNQVVFLDISHNLPTIAFIDCCVLIHIFNLNQYTNVRIINESKSELF